MADNDIDHIAELEQRLYTRDPEKLPERKFGILRPLKQNVTSTWGETDVPKNKQLHRTSITGYKRFFLVSLVFFILALGAALFSMYRGAMVLSSKNVDLTILGNSFVAGGEELPIQVEISNKNASDLVDTIITLDYPKGATDQAGSDIVHLKKELGTISSGKTKSEAFSAVLYGEQGISHQIKATLSYKLAGSSAVFQKEQTFSVMISSSPFALTVDAPPAVGAEQSFTLNVRNVFSGDKPIDNAVVRVEYPNGFVFQSATPAPLAGNNVWALGDLEKGTERTIAIRGKIAAEEGDEKSFRVYVGARESETDNRIAVSYNSALHAVTVAQPFITGTIAVNSKSTDIIALSTGDDRATGTVSWANTGPSVLTNTSLTLSITGESMDANTVSVKDGYYNPLEQTITWTPESSPELLSIAPGARGDLTFSFIPKRTSTSDIALALSVMSTFPDREYTQSTLTNIDQKIVRFASRLQFASRAFYSIGSIKNTGPFPPRAEQETTYTIAWTIRPTDNPLAGVRATAVLPPGVSWSGTIMPQNEPVTYLPENRTVTWNSGPLSKATATAQSKTVYFQVKVRPTKTQIGLEVPLLGETSIAATDTVANVPITLVRSPLSTKLDTDPVYTPGKEKVLP